MSIREGRLFGTSVSVKRGTCISGSKGVSWRRHQERQERWHGSCLESPVRGMFLKLQSCKSRSTNLIK